jgi:hypothetical protein
MGINDFIKKLKREGQYGEVDVTDDQRTLDLLASVNVRMGRVWAKKDWPWSLEELSFALTVGSLGPYSVTALADASRLVDRIIVLVPVDTSVSPNIPGKPLDQVELREYYGWDMAGVQRPDGAPPTRYVNIGQNSAGLWQVLINRAPSSAMTIKGWAKKVLTDYTIADVVANTPFRYFPPHIIDTVLEEGCRSDVARLNGDKAEATRLDLSFEAKLTEKGQEQQSAGVDNTPVTTPPPDGYRWKKRMRRASRSGNF